MNSRLKKTTTLIRLDSDFLPYCPRVIGFKTSFLPKMASKKNGLPRYGHILRMVARRDSVRSTKISVYLEFDFSYLDTGYNMIRQVRSVRLCQINLKNLPTVKLRLVNLIPVNSEDPLNTHIANAIIRSSKKWEFNKTKHGLWISTVILGRTRKCFILDRPF